MRHINGAKLDDARMDKILDRAFERKLGADWNAPKRAKARRKQGNKKTIPEFIVDRFRAKPGQVIPAEEVQQWLFEAGSESANRANLHAVIWLVRKALGEENGGTLKFVNHHTPKAGYKYIPPAAATRQPPLKLPQPIPPSPRKASRPLRQRVKDAWAILTGKYDRATEQWIADQIELAQEHSRRASVYRAEFERDSG